MKQLIVLLLVVAILLAAAPAFAAKGNPPGDGGFFTKFFNGVLETSWSKDPQPKGASTATKEQGESQRKKCSKAQW